MSNFKSCKIVDIQESLPFDIVNKKQQQLLLKFIYFISFIYLFIYIIFYTYFIIINYLILIIFI